jgi:hypothetical protein
MTTNHGVVPAPVYVRDPHADADDAAADAANKLHRKLMGFHAAFEPDLKAWLETKPTEDGLDMMHNALNLVAEDLYRFAGYVRDAHSALSISQKAELDNLVPAEQSTAARKAQNAAVQHSGHAAQRNRYPPTCRKRPRPKPSRLRCAKVCLFKWLAYVGGVSDRRPAVPCLPSALFGQVQRP